VQRWTRRYQYAPDSNRLLATRLPGDPDNLADYTATPGYSGKYGYDAHGNMTSMPHLSVMEWDFKDQLRATQRQVINNAAGEKTYYVYDGAGQRLRKVTETQHDRPKDERIYLGGFEVYRKYNGNAQNVTLERETLHIMDENQRVALVETRTRLVGADPAPRQLVRLQLGNHLGSAALELDDHAQVVSYEEYHPYGTTAYEAARSNETSKRYRFTGKERDEDSGLYYHGERYYAPWLGRWVSCDPAGMVDGINLFKYAKNNPAKYSDPTGKQSWTQSHSPAPASAVNVPSPPVPGSAQEAFQEGRKSGVLLGNKVGWAKHVLQQFQEGIRGESKGSSSPWAKMSAADRRQILLGVRNALDQLPMPPQYDTKERQSQAEAGFYEGFGQGVEQASLQVFALFVATELAIAVATEGAIRLPASSRALKSGVTGARLAGQLEAETQRAAEIVYAEIRSAGTGQLSTVAKNTGSSETSLSKIYNHLFNTEHDIAVAPNTVKRMRFSADPEIASLWKAAQQGKLEGKQLSRFQELMAHEAVEMRLMEDGLPYRSSDPSAWKKEIVNGAEDWTYYPQSGAYGAHDIAPLADPVGSGPLRHWVNLQVTGTLGQK